MAYMNIMNRNKSYIIPLCIILLFSTIILCCSKADDEDIQEKTSGVDNGSISEEQNLLTNGGLEEWMNFNVPEMPKGWSLPSNEFVRQNRIIVYEGGSSAKMQSLIKGNTARLEQAIPVEPNSKIRIRFHFYIEQWKPKGARTYCYFRTYAAKSSNISAKDLETIYDKDTYHIIRGGGYGLTYFMDSLNVWQTFDETIAVPDSATYFAFGINSYYGTIIYIDDCLVSSAK